jgi:hypothetical protein
LSTIGNVPLEWYDEYDHVGYDLEGKKITKPRVGIDKIDQFVETNEDPTAWYVKHIHSDSILLFGKILLANVWITHLFFKRVMILQL